MIKIKLTKLAKIINRPYLLMGVAIAGISLIVLIIAFEDVRKQILGGFIDPIVQKQMEWKLTDHSDKGQPLENKINGSGTPEYTSKVIYLPRFDKGGVNPPRFQGEWSYK